MTWPELVANEPGEITLIGPTDPPAWSATLDCAPFRCGRCGRVVSDGRGQWVARDQPGDPAYGMSGQFMAVHAPACPSRWSDTAERSGWPPAPPTRALLVATIAIALVALVGTFAILVYLLATGRP